MPSPQERIFERMERLIQRLIAKSKFGIPIIVEGRKDERSLRRLGVEGNILCMKSAGQGFFDFIEKVKPSREAIVLTDFDREGKHLSLQLLKELSSNRVKVDNSFRRQFGSLCRSDVRSVEELADYMERLRQMVVA